jgi:hypothetical protein
MKRFVCTGVALTVAFGLARSAGAWGTAHTEITRHALKALPASDRAEARLAGLRQMEDFCWGGDYQGEVQATYYVDDYLLFPGFPHHSSHLMPNVANTWKPFFQRTLQALRGESPQNAARWMGSLLHFIQDSGSPPHAFPQTGGIHTRMENFIYNFDIRLPDYQPRELGRTDESALDGLTQRLEGLVAYSRERGEKLVTLAATNNRPASEPLTLECAQETMRVVADTAHTLLRLTESGPREGTASLTGTLVGPVMREFPYAPTRVILEGTPYSTVADPMPQLPGSREYGATFVLGDLPPGKYTVALMRTSCKTLRKKVTLKRNGTKKLKIKLEADSPQGNLVRNPDFSVRWLRPSGPDHWTATGDEWVSDAFRVTPGEIYELGAFSGKARREVAVRLSDNPRMPGSAERKDLFGENRFQPTTHYAQLIIKGGEEPTYAFARPVPRKR